MNNNQKKAAEYIRSLLKEKMVPRNQVASLSGLSNAYIRHLEQGNIANVNRAKLIAFAVALSLDLQSVDHLLTIFDRTKLTSEDIPLFLENAGQRKISAAMLPLHAWYTYELHVM
ncbi:MAG: helix-turn-helix domain-containing protein, partial [Deltaproteobacteria bacterium]|nr:helix-turn-helix domain-containing protein [Deltaproteobacteria bacterium]